MVKEMNKTKYIETVYKNIRDQLNHINLILEATKINHQIHPINYDHLVDDTVYVSTLNVKTVQEILDAVDSIKQNSSSAKVKQCIYTLAAGFTLIGSFLVIRNII